MQNFIKYIFIIPLIFSGIIGFAQNHDLLKNFLTVENGLSHNEVTSIVQDKDGFIWIGTRGGLNRYDGYEFKIFNQIPGDSNSLVNPSIESLFEDSKGNIWIGTKSGGVSKYNPVTGVFKNIITNYKQKSKMLPDNRILSFFEDKAGRIWMGTWENGLIVFDEEKNTSAQILSIPLINSIKESSSGEIWVGTQNGLYEFIEEEYTFIRHAVGPCQEIIFDAKRNAIWLVGGNNTGLRRFDLRDHRLDTYNIIDSKINANGSYNYESLFIDKQDRIWIGTWGNGFFTFDLNTEVFSRQQIYPENRATINKDYDAILDIFEDNKGNIWLGTNGGGVVVLTEKLGFNSIGYHPEFNKGITNTRIMSVIDDRNGNLWLGTIGGGLFWSPDKENFYPVRNNRFNDSRFFIIKYLYEDISGNIWAGTNNGTFIIEFSNNVPVMKLASIKFNNPNFSRQFVSFLDDNNILWSGSLQNGLFLLDKSNNYETIKRITKQNSSASGLQSDRISYLFKDFEDRVWIGTYNGLHVFNAKDSSIQVAENYFKITGDFTGNIITCIDEDQKGNIWIGTPNGLNKLVQTGENEFSIEYYTEKNGLASNFVKGISHDAQGNIWLSTNIGISKFNTNENLFINFDETDGVKGKSFTEASVCRNSNGEIFFGGAQGLTWFNPDEIINLTSTPEPVFTGLSVLNQPVEIGKKYNNKIILSQSITRTKEIELSYRQNKLEIQFSALDFDSNGKNQYQIFLENYDEDWHSIGFRRFAIFNNLKPGEYTLNVKSANRHNVWNENPAQVKIVVKPPFWQTWYALAFYILAVIGIVTIIRWNAVKQVRLANSLELEKLKHEQDTKLNEMKLRFFTNISHEFRTPLTLILAPLKELIRKKEKFEISDNVAHKINIVQNNSLRLMNLVNQLLDFRKIESGTMKLTASNTNLEEFVSNICYTFFELAEINNIRFKFKSALKTKNIWFDRDKLEIIINNLVSNAFKYLKENGKIEVALYEEEEEVLISVSDNGPGIPPTEIRYIFDRFYRVDQQENDGSSGIGLALVKRYAELHKGNVSVTSQANIYTEFVVSLPKGNKHLKPEEMVEHEETEPLFVGEKQFYSTNLTDLIKSDAEECILIVEDNPEVSQYLKELLGSEYCIELASTGFEGLEKATELNPNLIISDVKMPKMDGFEFCKKVRENEKTSTIPFIFLTAKSEEQFRLLGTQLGADDFIAKPFDPNLLVEKVKNILANRKKLQKKYSKSIRLEPSDIEITSSDEAFIEKIILIIENNLQNHKFNSDVLASEMNMSNSSLYRKLKGLIDSSTAEFIRSIRIKRAAQLLADKEKTITEIAYEVGFNDVKHFRTVFQKQFSCSPSEYRDKL